MSRRIHVRVSLLVVSLVVFSACFVLEDVLCYRCDERVHSKPTETPWFRRATKSLSELPKVPELSDHILMFNRVPKSGGEALVLMLQLLQGRNSFRHIRLPGIGGTMDRKLQKAYTTEISNMIREQAIPLSFDKSIYFVNFTEFSIQSPIHVNLIRDPFDNVLSRMSDLPTKGSTIAYEIKMVKTVSDKMIECWSSGNIDCMLSDGSPYDFFIPYFCGHEPECAKFNSDWALSRAKNIVDRYYPIVGVLDHLNETAILLEERLPLFFRGASEVYTKRIADSQKKWKRKTIMKKILEDRLKNVLAKEYEFYTWIKARLFSQIKSKITNK